MIPHTTSRLPLGLRPALAALLAACASGPGTAGDGPTPIGLPGITLNLDEETYLVTGRTVPEIGLSLQRMSPYLRNRSVRGIHRYDISWRFSYVTVEDRCRVDDVQIEINSTVVLPRWSRPAGVEPELEEAWDVYLRDIREHEDQHRELAIRAALEVQQTLERLEAPRCTEELGLRANRTGREIMARYRARNQAFDRASPGARWPPYGLPSTTGSRRTTGVGAPSSSMAR